MQKKDESFRGCRRDKKTTLYVGKNRGFSFVFWPSLVCNAFFQLALYVWREVGREKKYCFTPSGAEGPFLLGCGRFGKNRWCFFSVCYLVLYRSGSDQVVSINRNRRGNLSFIKKSIMYKESQPPNQSSRWPIALPKRRKERGGDGSGESTLNEEKMLGASASSGGLLALRSWGRRRLLLVFFFPGSSSCRVEAAVPCFVSFAFLSACTCCCNVFLNVLIQVWKIKKKNLSTRRTEGTREIYADSAPHARSLLLRIWHHIVEEGAWLNIYTPHRGREGAWSGREGAW